MATRQCLLARRAGDSGGASIAVQHLRWDDLRRCGIVRPLRPELPDYVAVEMNRSALELVGQVGIWNMLWEAGQFSRRFFDIDALPKPIVRIAERGHINTILVPRTQSRYFEYAPLFHLLPTTTLDRFGLPLLRRGQWPFMADHGGVDRFLPSDFEDRLAKAWA